MSGSVLLLLSAAALALYWILSPLAEPPGGAEDSFAEGDFRARRRAAALGEIEEDLAMGKITPEDAAQERERV